MNIRERVHLLSYSFKSSGSLIFLFAVTGTGALVTALTEIHLQTKIIVLSAVKQHAERYFKATFSPKMNYVNKPYKISLYF